MPLDLTQLTEKQKDILLRLAKLTDTGDVGVLDEITTLQERLDTLSRAVNDSLVHLVRMVENVKTVAKGDPGYTPQKGIDYRDGQNYVLTPRDLEIIAKKVNVPVVDKVIEKIEIIKEQPIIKTEIKETIIKDKTETAEEIVLKLESLQKENRLNASAIRNLPQIIKETRPFIGGRVGVQVRSNGTKVGTKANELNFTTGFTITNVSGVPTIVGTGSGYQVPLTGGLTGTNTWTTAPSVIVVDGVPMQKTRTDLTPNWTGTTTTVLTVIPSYDIFASA